nr:hypothetical protein [Ignavibacteriaceae bacterium]
VQGGKATITPNIGHTEGQFTTDFTFEPYKGVVFAIDKKPQTEILDPGQSNPFPMGMPSSTSYPAVQPPMASQNNFQQVAGSPPPRYKPLSEIEVVNAPMAHTNQYSKEEFNLILNNQVALYKSTGQAFTLIVFKLDPQAEAAGIISTNQLNNAIRLSLTLKEKVCIDGFTTIVLLGKSDERALSVLTSKIRSNLQSNDPTYLPRVLSVVYAFTYVSNATTENADGILREVL